MPTFSTTQLSAYLSRVLRPGGVYLMISHSEPQARLPYLISPLLLWNVTVYVIAKQVGSGVCFYLCQKVAMVNPWVMTFNHNLLQEWVQCATECQTSLSVLFLQEVTAVKNCCT